MIAAVILAAAIQVADAGPRLYGWPQECAYSYGLQSASGEFTPEETQRKYENCLRSNKIPNPEAKSMCSAENATYFPVCRKATRSLVPGAEQ